MVIAGRPWCRNLPANDEAGLPRRRESRHARPDAGDHRLNGKRIGEADRQITATPPEPSQMPKIEHRTKLSIRQQHPNRDI